jgi:hypothetical protein
MKRFIAVAIMAFAMSAWWAVPAIAGCSPGYQVKAPNPSSKGADKGNPPPTDKKACVPQNDGTGNAADQSPAVTTTYCNFG